MVETLSKKALVRPEFLVCCLLLMSTLWVYLPVMGYDFISYDDLGYVVENYHVKQGLTLENIKWSFTSFCVANWHPVTWLSHMLDCQLYGLDPGKHHTTNLILHILNSILLFFVFFRSTGQIYPSSFVAAFFALHPMHVESVAWIAERKDVLSTFFMLITFLFYIAHAKSKNRKAYWISVAFFALGLMAKPMIVTLPFLLLLFDYWPLGRFQLLPCMESEYINRPDLGKFIKDSDIVNSKFLSFFKSRAYLFTEKIPFFILSTLSSYITIIAQHDGRAIVSITAYPIYVRFCDVFISYIEYIKKMFYPFNLAVFYPQPAVLNPYLFYISFSLVIITSLIAIYFFKKKPYIFTGWFWYLGTLVPVIGIVQVGSQFIADRYTYIPFTGLFVMILWIGYDLFGRHHIGGKIMTAIFMSSLFVLTPLARYQVELWADSITLFQHALIVTKNNVIAHGHLGMALRNEKNDHIEAIRHFEEALRISPDFAPAYIELGLTYEMNNEKEKAINCYKKAIELDSNFVTPYYNLGFIYMQKGVYEESLRYLNKAILVDSDYALAYNCLGAVYAKNGDAKKALLNFQKALDLGFHPAQKNVQAMIIAIEKGGGVDFFSGSIGCILFIT